MANKNIFGSNFDNAPVADTVNEAGGKAYKMTTEHALAQLVMTGTMHPTFYVSAEKQTEKILELTEKVSSLFLSQLAIYAREKGYMKDTPALLLAILLTRAKMVPEAEELVAPTFNRVIDNVKMLRTFVQIVRSGVAGRKNLGTKVKNLIRRFLNSRDAAALLRASVGPSPSLSDIIKMVHPVPNSPEQRGTYAYLIGKELPAEATLPEFIRDFENFRNNRKGAVPNVPFQLIDNMQLTAQEWSEVIKNGGWHFVRMNLNTFARHKVYERPGMTELISSMLRNEDSIRKAKVFPYQLFTTYKALDDSIPMKVKLALQDAMEIAISNVPKFHGTVAVCNDTSGSMESAVTGARGSATTSTTCVEVGALLASTVLRGNEETIVLPFDTQVRKVALNPRDSVLTNAGKLALRGGGTDVASPLQHLLDNKIYPDLVIIISDNESWFNNTYRYSAFGDSPKAMKAWALLKKKNKNAKLVCIDIQPYHTTQFAENDGSILSVGGFSDNVFTVIDNFVNGFGPGKWVEDIKKIRV